MAENPFKYTPMTKEQVKKRRERRGGSFDSILKDVPTFKAKDDHRLRLMPPTFKGAEHFGLDVYVHYDVGADKSAYLCLTKHGKGECPICKAQAKAQRNGEDEEYVKSLRPNNRILVYVIDRDKEEDGPLAWAMPYKLDKAIVTLSQDKRTGEIIDLVHPDEGYDVEFAKEGKGLKTDYTGVRIAHKPSPLADSPKRQAKWLDHIVENPLNTILNFYDAEYIAEVFNGGASSSGKKRDADDDDDRDRGERKRSRDDDDDKPRTRREIDDDAEDIDKPAKKRERDDDDDDRPKKRRDDDDDDDAPKKRERDADDDDRPAKKKPAEDDDADDRPAKKRERVDDDDDDDDRPKKRERVEDDDDDARPAKKKPADDDDDDAPKKKRREDDDDDDDGKTAVKKSLREDDDDDDDRPAKKRERVDDDDDDRPAKKKVDDDDDDDRPKKRREDDDDDDRPAKKRRDDDDD